MDEIRQYRGKRTDGKGWVYGNLYEYKGDTYILSNGRDSNASGFMTCGCSSIEIYGYYKVIPETVGQDTGEIYKSGQKIWEGDLFNHGGDVYQVIWKSGSYKAHMIYYKWLEKDTSKENRYGYIDQWKTYDTEYIGTIHDEVGV